MISPIGMTRKQSCGQSKGSMTVVCRVAQQQVLKFGGSSGALYELFCKVLKLLFSALPHAVRRLRGQISSIEGISPLVISDA